jgi:hypothetical protein
LRHGRFAIEREGGTGANDGGEASKRAAGEATLCKVAALSGSQARVHNSSRVLGFGDLPARALGAKRGGNVNRKSVPASGGLVELNFLMAEIQR